MTSNIKSLTQSHKVIRAKRKQKREQVPAIVFDEDARREFLTGFHKRKLAKKEESKKRALAREKQEHLEARREKRRVLAEQATQNAAKVEAAYGGFVQSVSSIGFFPLPAAHEATHARPDTGSDDEEWHGIASAPSNDAGLEQETYSDEEQLATVTIVEDFDPSTLIHGPTSSSEPQVPFQPLPSSPQKGRERVKDGEEGRKTEQKEKRDGEAACAKDGKGRIGGWKVGTEDEGRQEETTIKGKTQQQSPLAVRLQI
ncbi:nucleolar protein 12-domain-containing protein [Lactarius pseudohatsudake]|nr:nucleolar protein 12-domain-containing protein [Lactarius pseudohatsudake]